MDVFHESVLVQAYVKPKPIFCVDSYLRTCRDSKLYVQKKDTCKILAFGVCTNPTFQNFPLLWKEEERMNEEAEEAATATACIPPHPSAGNFGGRAQTGGKRGSGGGGKVD